MGLKLTFKKRSLDFLFEAGTSRGVLSKKDIHIIKVIDTINPSVIGYGEASPLQGLSIDDVPDFDDILILELSKFENLDKPTNEHEALKLAARVSSSYPSIRFAVETALLDLTNGGTKRHFSNGFYSDGDKIQINGLIWMGDNELMKKRLLNKINDGFSCIKIKIGAIDLNQEFELLKNARAQYNRKKLELRVDANGAFTFEEAHVVLAQLNSLNVHSIEQPIKAGQRELMFELCKNSPVPIALDEELIDVHSYEEKSKLLNEIMPHFVILKPTLLGGFASCLEWIKIADKLKIGWWLTSALESNIGLNAICQFASHLQVSLPQGLGTGNLYSNNIDSPLEVIKDSIGYNKSKKWGDPMAEPNY